MTLLTLRRLHLWAAVAWIALLVPIFLWFRENVFWIILVSHYANAVGHLSAFQGCRAEEAAATAPTAAPVEDGKLTDE